MKAGELKDRIKMFRIERTPNDSGGGAFSPVEYLSTFAKVTELSSDPAIVASMENVKQVVKIEIRFRPDLVLTNGDKAEWRGSSFTLNNFKVDNMRTKIEMVCTFIENNSKRSS